MPDVLTTEETNTTVATDVYKTREAVVHSVRERHSEAAKTMDKSLNTIFNDFENDIVIENNYAFGEISGDLDDLLK